MTVPVLHGEEVVLRPVAEEDHPLILAWQNEPEVWWWMDYERTFTLEDIHESEARAAVEGHPFIIEVDGRPIGRIGLNQFSERDETCSLYVFIGDR
ncbi:MAG TPA: GNAT family N-acetyltransferase, partial [Actinomycetota bacterium]